MTEAGLTRVETDAESRGVPIEVVSRPAARSLDEAAALLGIRPSLLVKTLVVRRHDRTHLFALVPGDRQLSWRKLRMVVGVSKLRLPDAFSALEATGHERGTITPFGSTTAWPVYADESIAGSRIAMGAGAHGFSLFVEADDLFDSFAAVVADITDPLP